MPWKSRTKYVLVSCYPSLVLVRKERDPTPTPKKWAAFSFSVTCSRLSSLGRRQQHWCPPHHNHHLMHNWISGCVDGTTTMCVLHNDCRDAADRVSWLWAGSGMGEHSTYFWRPACSCNLSGENSLRGERRKSVNLLEESPPVCWEWKEYRYTKVQLYNALNSPFEAFMLLLWIYLHVLSKQIYPLFPPPIKTYYSTRQGSKQVFFSYFGCGVSQSRAS